jgi:hypothetical protein
MLRIKVFKFFTYSYHENTLPWKNIFYLNPYTFNYMLPLDTHIYTNLVCEKQHTNTTLVWTLDQCWSSRYAYTPCTINDFLFIYLFIFALWWQKKLENIGGFWFLNVNLKNNLSKTWEKSPIFQDHIFDNIYFDVI